MDTIKYLNKKRNKTRKILRTHGVLPPYPYITPLTREQKFIEDKLKSNDYGFYEEFKKTKIITIPNNFGDSEEITEVVEIRSKTPPKRIHHEWERPILKRARLKYELIQAGILPADTDHYTEEEQKILDFINENYETPIVSFIANHCPSPEHRMWYKVKNTTSKRKKKINDFDLEISDIIIPKYCPYLGIELTTILEDCTKDNYYSIDRIDSTKGYVKGNIMIISRLANTMKNNASIDLLKQFAKGITTLWGE